MLYKTKKRLIIIKELLFIYHLHGFPFDWRASQARVSGWLCGEVGRGGDKGWGETLEEKRGRRLELACVLPYLYHLTKTRQVYKKHCKPGTSLKILVYL